MIKLMPQMNIMPLESIVIKGLRSGSKQFGIVEMNNTSKLERTDTSGAVGTVN